MATQTVTYCDDLYCSIDFILLIIPYRVQKKSQPKKRLQNPQNADRNHNTLFKHETNDAFELKIHLHTQTNGNKSKHKHLQFWWLGLEINLSAQQTFLSNF